MGNYRSTSHLVYVTKIYVTKSVRHAIQAVPGLSHRMSHRLTCDQRHCGAESAATRGRWNEGCGRLFPRDLALEVVGQPALPELLNRPRSPQANGSHGPLMWLHRITIESTTPLLIDRRTLFHLGCLLGCSVHRIRGMPPKKKTTPTHYKSFTEVSKVQIPLFKIQKSIAFF